MRVLGSGKGDHRYTAKYICDSTQSSHGIITYWIHTCLINTYKRGGGEGECQAVLPPCLG